ncbi:MAG: thioredoxin family protein [Planctomycetota bacterium]
MNPLARIIRTPLGAVAIALFATTATAAPEGWTEDFPAAQAEAKEAGKDLLLEFTGSDWCPPCKALNGEVFSTSAFMDSAPSDFVLVKLDFPSNIPQSETLVNQNNALASKYNIEGYPTIVLADAAGKPYAMTGYRPGGAESYLAHLDELKAIRATRDAALAEAKDAEGLDKARALDVAMQAVGLDLAIAHYPSHVEYIIAIDADNKAGLKEKYEGAMNAGALDAAMSEAIEILRAGDFEAGLKKLDTITEELNPQGESLQMITVIRGQVHRQMGEMDQAVSLMKQAIAIDPESEISAQIQAMIEEIENMPAAP